jgi:very-short-patch-repair endonuclease
MGRNVALARGLRRRQTDAERMLWFQVRDRRLGGWKFKRQVFVDKYVVDFLCADAHLIIEIDGGQHAERRDHDDNRTRILETMGYLVLRFWNNEVLSNIEGVVETIMNTMDEHRSVPPHPDPLPIGERERRD